MPAVYINLEHKRAALFASPVALYIVISTNGADRILNAVKKHGTGTAVAATGSTTSADGLIAGLLAYTERHEGRLDRLVEGSYLLDYTLDSMNVLIDVEKGGGAEAIAAANEFAQ